MNTDRLLTLANRLERVPEDRWDLDIFWDECNSEGCALGWAAQWEDLGLKWLNGYIVLIDESERYPKYGFEAVQEAFDITFEEADNLFGGNHWGAYEGMDCNTIPSDVAAAIRVFVGATPMPEFVVDTTPVPVEVSS